jgi:hypothetical protein
LDFEIILDETLEDCNEASGDVLCNTNIESLIAEEVVCIIEDDDKSKSSVEPVRSTTESSMEEPVICLD